MIDLAAGIVFRFTKQAKDECHFQISKNNNKELQYNLPPLNLFLSNEMFEQIEIERVT
jgi:hypothetical protein